MSAESPAPPPSAASISDALAALGVYANVPSAEDLEQHALDAGGELRLAAALANALYGAAIGVGMLAEGHMLAECDGTTEQAEQLGLARNQALQASGATGPGVIGMMHWQAAHVGGLLRGLAKGDQIGPLGSAAAAAAWALVLILDVFSVVDLTDPRKDQLLETIAEAREQLVLAGEHLERMTGMAIDLAAELVDLVAAAEHASGIGSNGHG